MIVFRDQLEDITPACQFRRGDSFRSGGIEVGGQFILRLAGKQKEDGCQFGITGYVCA